jgi:hypothetical protein
MTLTGYIQCPTQAQKKPYGKEGEKHQEAGGGPFHFPLNGFRGDLIYAISGTLSSKVAKDKSTQGRAATLYSQYLNALRKDHSLIYLRE